MKNVEISVIRLQPGEKIFLSEKDIRVISHVESREDPYQVTVVYEDGSEMTHKYSDRLRVVL